MAITHVKLVGSMMHLISDDGSVALAYPTAIDAWALGGPSGGDPEPEPGGARFQWPFPLSTVSSEYGPRSGRVHQGIDLAPGNNVPIPAAGAGKIHISGWHNNFGNWVVIQHPPVGSSGPLYTVYAHMISASTWQAGQAINRGQIVGRVGNTGASFGAHLHFETHVGSLGWTNPGPHINPRVFMDRYAN